MKSTILHRTVSIVMICLIALSMLMVSTVSAAADSEILYKCSFEGATTKDNPSTDSIENKAQSSTMTNYDWSYWNGNNFIGYFGHDEETGRNYLSIDDADYSPKGGFKISSSVISEGKVYFSFSYRRPGEASGPVFIRITDGTNSADLAMLTTTLGLCTSMTSGATSTVGEFSDEKWHELGFVFDLDAKTVTAYADGVASSGTVAIPDTMSGIKCIAFGVNSDTALKCHITDIIVKSGDGLNEISGQGSIDGDEITVELTEAVGSDVSVGSVAVELCGSEETVDVSDISRAGATLKLICDGSLAGGREYRVVFGTDIKTLFGNTIAPVYFSTPTQATYTYMKDIADSEASAVVETENFPNGVIDFENLSLAPDVEGVAVTNGQVTSPGDFYTYISTGNKLGKIVEVNKLTKADGTSIASGTGNASDYAWRGWGWAGMGLGKAPEEDFNGTVVYEFDYYFPSVANASASIALTDSNGARKNLAGMPRQNSSWERFRLEYNFASRKAVVYISGSKYAEYTTLSDGTAIPDNIVGMNINFGSDMKYADLFIDNFTQYYVEEKVSVRSVRYVDADDNITGLDTITPSTKAIEIKFSEDMDEDSLDDITLDYDDVTDVDYDEDTFTYTLILDNLLSQNSGYVLTIPATVCSVSGAYVQETVYYFDTLDGEFRLFNLGLNRAGDDIFSLDDIAGATINASVDLINTVEETGDITIIYCLYDDDALVDVNYDTVTVTEGMATLTTKDFAVRSGITPDCAKVFVRSGSMNDFDFVLPAREY